MAPVRWVSPTWNHFLDVLNILAKTQKLVQIINYEINKLKYAVVLGYYELLKFAVHLVYIKQYYCTSIWNYFYCTKIFAVHSEKFRISSIELPVFSYMNEGTRLHFSVLKGLIKSGRSKLFCHFNFEFFSIFFFFF